MAKRRRKKDPIAELLGLSVMGVFFFVFSKSNSFEVSGIFAGIWIGICLAGSFAYDQVKNDCLKRSGITEIDKMDGRQFEHYLGLLFKTQGYKTTVTRAAGDYGADLVIEKEGKKIVVQAKRYSKNVGIEAVQQAQASIAHYKAHEAWVVSNSDYTDAARNLASSNSVRLINRKMLIKMILEMNPQAVPDPKNVIEELPQKQIKCDRCGSSMVLRKGQKYEFYGCSAYPKCRSTKAI